MAVERLLIVAGLIVLATAVYWLFKRVQMRRLSAVTARDARPQLLYFASDACAACPTQNRYVEQVAQQWHGRLAIHKIDAEQDREAASRYGVFTLPTTILVDTAGTVREINYGLTNAHKLNQQLAAVLG